MSGETVLNSDRAMLLHETGRFSVLYVPFDNIRQELLALSSK
ncbi:hypothetical protein BH20ACT4_BH20ACT4_03800 [soil metagenome]